LEVKKMKANKSSRLKGDVGGLEAKISELDE
jgi:hypothetical protein